jgi:Cys-rich protein (TIGR01571 family)
MYNTIGKEESIPIVQATPVAVAVGVDIGHDETTSLLGVADRMILEDADSGGVSRRTINNRRTATTWKDGLCSCCKFGPCHPSFLNACCCPQILMAQVLTRMRLSMLGNPAPEHVYKSTFKNVVILVIAYYSFRFMFGCPSAQVLDSGDHDGRHHNDVDCPTWQRSLGSLVSTAFGLYTLIVMIKLRAAVRDRFGITTTQTYCPNESMEDCCCVFWCGCCTVSQLARQTADYDVYLGVCCSPTGLPMSAAAAANSVIIV